MANAALAQAHTAMTKQLVIGADASHRALAGDEKAAVLLLALGPDFGKPILEELDEMEIRQLSRAMVRLGPITQDMLDTLLVEFVTRISSNGTIAGNSDTTERLLLSFLPQDRVDSIMEEIRGPAGRNMWEKLSQRAGGRARQLPQERIPADHRRGAVQDRHRPCRQGAGRPARRTGDGSGAAHAALDPVQKDILEKIETTLRTEFMSTLATPSAATAMSRWPKSSTPSTARPKRASSPPSRSATATAPSASRR